MFACHLFFVFHRRRQSTNQENTKLGWQLDWYADSVNLLFLDEVQTINDFLREIRECIFNYPLSPLHFVLDGFFDFLAVLTSFLIEFVNEVMKFNIMFTNN